MRRSIRGRPGDWNSRATRSKAIGARDAVPWRTVEPDTRFDTLVDLMLTVGYIDGNFDAPEQDVVQQYLEQLAVHLGAGDEQRAHFDAVYARLESEIGALAAEVTATGDEAFVSNRLKVRAVALFRAFPPSDQVVALELVRAVMGADGAVHPSEQELHGELLAYFVPAPVAAPSIAPPPGELLQIDPAQTAELAALSHPLLDPLEQAYAADPNVRHAQIGADYELIFQAISTWSGSARAATAGSRASPTSRSCRSARGCSTATCT